MCRAETKLDILTRLMNVLLILLLLLILYSPLLNPCLT